MHIVQVIVLIKSFNVKNLKVNVDSLGINASKL